MEIHGLRVEAIGTVPKPQFPRAETGGTLEEALKEYREVYFEETSGFIRTPVYHRSKISAHTEIDGPAIVEQLDSTIVIPPGVHAKVDEYRNIIMSFR